MLDYRAGVMVSALTGKAPGLFFTSLRAKPQTQSQMRAAAQRIAELCG